MRKQANTQVAKRLQFNQWPLEAGCLWDESLLNWPVCINVTSSAGKQLYFVFCLSIFGFHVKF